MKEFNSKTWIYKRANYVASKKFGKGSKVIAVGVYFDGIYDRLFLKTVRTPYGIYHSTRPSIRTYYYTDRKRRTVAVHKEITKVHRSGVEASRDIGVKPNWVYYRARNKKDNLEYV